jgi:uncharacterized protein with PhoU and TrkA domain
MNYSPAKVAKIIEQRLAEGKSHLVTDLHLQTILNGYRTVSNQVAFLEAQIKQLKETQLRMRHMANGGRVVQGNLQ